jgi:FtsP/CotA-like multicopper oxidase with cupredoxin domain/peroxiredoxin/ketosteroid isomerase-like protein
MTPAKWAPTIFVGLLIAAPCFSGSTDEVVKTLTKLELDWANAVERNDVDAIGSFLHPDFTFTSPVGGIANRQDHLNDFRNGNSRFTLVALSEVEVRDYGQMAVVTSRPTINGTVKVNGNIVTLTCLGARWTDALILQGGSWKCVARHQSNIPPPPTRAMGGPGASPNSLAPANERRIESQPANTPYRQRSRQRYLEEQSVPRQGAVEFRRFDATAAALPSLQPVTVRSQNGRLDLELSVDYATVHIGNDDVRLRVYNGQLVGPVLRVKAGDTLYITLRNKLPPQPGAAHIDNGHHEWNTTNLHFHGLHVAPQGPMGQADRESDNVLLELKPTTDPAGAVQKYEVKIPPTHVAGTFWYHAHKHGAVAAQVASGMAGALIIERDDAQHNLDSVPQVAAAVQEVMVLQQIPYLRPDPSLPGAIEQSPDGSGSNEDQMLSPGAWQPLKRYVTVNGLRIPTITMAPGEVRRFRLIDSGQREPIKLQIERAPTTVGTGADRLKFYEIAVDGLPTGGIRELDSVDLFPGYRSDVLINPPADTSGEYYLVDANLRNPNGGPSTDTGADGSSELVRWVAKIVVTGSPVSMSRPLASALLPHRLPDLSLAAVTQTRYAFYGLVFPPPPIGGTNYFISRENVPPGQMPTGTEFNLSNPRVLTLGRTERWFVGTRNGNNVQQFHPFHIHTNPFLITRVTRLQNGVPVDVTATEIGAPTWRDTLAMKQGYTYELLTRYDDFIGSFVNHCHILDHEDNGMMELVRIDPATPTPAPLDAGLGSRASPQRIRTTIAESNGSPSVLLFVKGPGCPHCLAQIRQLSELLAARGVSTTVISPTPEGTLQDFPKGPFTLVADPECKLFKQHDAFAGQPKHATIVRDRSGKVVFRAVADEPFTNTEEILAAVEMGSPRFVIAVRKTDTTADDYLTWAPAPCQIRMENGTAGGPDVTVTLTNDPPAAIPDGGDVRFARTLAPGQTAKDGTLTLPLKQDGTPVDFFMAGSKASTLTPSSLLNGGRDAVIEIHQGDANGPLLGTTAVMVRVRKDISTLNALEMSEFLKALADLHFTQNRLEWYVRLHRLATHHEPPDDPLTWPDQAHRGPAFIAWHRVFLLQFERELQTKFPHVALPYWVQGRTQTFFSRSLFGENTEGGDEVVTFDRPNPLSMTGSPLYGWSISLEHDTRLGTPGPMGLLRRSTHNHNLPPTAAFYQQWGPRLQGLSNFKDAFPDAWGLSGTSPVPNGTNANFNVERDPHNKGHGRVGPDGVWMQNCRESNADPVFYVFHCNHDHLWAKWQQYHNRFDNQAGHQENYWPSDAYTDPGTDTTVPRGHHLNDRMWPWDGSTSADFPGERPDTNGFGNFPKAPFPYEWPTAQAQPRPADAIDYLNVSGSSNELGFCYDDVPYGAATPVAGPQLARRSPEATEDANSKLNSEIFLNNTVSPDLRLAAVGRIEGAVSTMNAKTLLPVVLDKSSATDVRVEALHRMAVTSPKDAARAAAQVLDDPNSPASLGAKTIEEMGSLLHFSPLPHAHMAQVHESLRRVVTGRAPGHVKAAALRLLAPTGDAAAGQQLIAFLQDPSTAPLSLPQTISLLRFFPNHYEAIRQQIMSPRDEVAISAIHALYNDAKSAAQRRQLAADRSRSVSVRKAAIQSLMHDDSVDGVAVLLGIFGDAADDLDVRAEAVAAAKVYFQRKSKGISAADKAAWLQKIQAVPTGVVDRSELAALKEQALNALTAK